jgi:hypothetical protein
MNAREELAKLLTDTSRAYIGEYGAYVDEVEAPHLADAILAAGYRKPYTVTTHQERAELLPGTICVDLDGNAWKRGTGSWVSTGGDTEPLFDDVQTFRPLRLKQQRKPCARSPRRPELPKPNGWPSTATLPLLQGP